MNILSFKSVVISLAMSLLFVFTACQKDDTLQDIPVQETIVDGSVYDGLFVENSLLETPVIATADENMEFSIVVDGVPEDLDNSPSTLRLDSNGNRHVIWDCLDSLGLTQSQVDSIKMAGKANLFCKYVHIVKIRQINATIIANANKQRLALLYQYHQGNITLARLRIELLKVKVETMIELAKNPAKRHHLLAIKECNRKYALRLKVILTPQQWQAFIICRTTL